RRNTIEAHFRFLDEAPAGGKRTGAYNADYGDASPTSSKHLSPAGSSKARRKDRAPAIEESQDRLICFKRTASIFEMRFVAAIWKNRKDQNEQTPKEASASPVGRRKDQLCFSQVRRTRTA